MRNTWMLLLAAVAALLFPGCRPSGNPSRLPSLLMLTSDAETEPCIHTMTFPVSFTLRDGDILELRYSALPAGWSVWASALGYSVIPDVRGPRQTIAGIEPFGERMTVTFHVELDERRVEDPERSTTVRIAATIRDGTGRSQNLFDDPIRVTAPNCEDEPSDPDPPPTPASLQLAYIWVDDPFSEDHRAFESAADGTDHQARVPASFVQWEAQVSPDARWLAFVGAPRLGSTSWRDIYLIDRADPAAVPYRLTAGEQARSRFEDIRWSRDSTQLACRRVTSAREVLVRVELPTIFAPGAGAIGIELTIPSDDAKPTWGPNDEVIAFTRNRKLHYLDLATGVVTADRTVTANIEDVAWSPDGNLLAYWQAGGLGFSDIWILNRTLDRVERVTDGLADSVHYANPTWAPDSDTLVFTGYVGEVRLYSKKLSDGVSAPAIEMPVSAAQKGNFSYPSIFVEPTK